MPKYRVTVQTIVEADNAEQAVEHLWDGQTEVDVVEIKPSTTIYILEEA